MGYLAVLIGTLLFSPLLTPLAADLKSKRKVLYLTHSAGYRHTVLPLSERVLQELGENSGAFVTTTTEDCSLINDDNLKQYSALIFFTSGELPFSAEQKRAFLDFIKAGNGFVGIHSATDTFYQWPEYGQLIGAYFDQHPWHQEVTIEVVDDQHPAVAHLAPSFTIKDEIYQFRDVLPHPLHVLLKLDTRSVDLQAKNVKRQDHTFALAWTNAYGKGRVFYTALGHRDDVWQDTRFHAHLVNGIRWAIKDLQ
jgi:type 1 glutamine amidotransferase